MRARGARALAAVALATLVSSGVRAEGPLAGVVLDDEAGRAWRLDGLAGVPVLVVLADRFAAEEADAWGARLAGANLPLAPWRAEDEVTWLAVADLRRVPEWARDAARARVREREARRGSPERRQSSPLLLDWRGVLAERFRPDRGTALVALLAADGRVLLQERGAVTEAAVDRLRRTIAGIAGD